MTWCLDHSINVVGPGQIFCDIYTEELETLDHFPLAPLV